MKLQIENQRLHNACSKIIKAMSFNKTQKSNISVLIEADRNGRTLKLTAANFTAGVNIPFTSILMKLNDVDVFESGETVITLLQLIEFTESLKDTEDCNTDKAG